MEKKIDICSTCQFGVKNYISVIGTIPWCCEKHWHCKPGSLARDYMPKKDKGEEVVADSVYFADSRQTAPPPSEGNAYEAALPEGPSNELRDLDDDGELPF